MMVLNKVIILIHCTLTVYRTMNASIAAGLYELLLRSIFFHGKEKTLNYELFIMNNF